MQPCKKKNLTVFQNSYTATEQEPYQVSVPTYGKAGWRMDEAFQAYAGSAWSVHNDSAFSIRVVNNGFTTTIPAGGHYYTPYTQQRLETPKVYNANTGAFIAQAANYSATVQTGSHQETRYRDVQITKWNTKWRKRST